MQRKWWTLVVLAVLIVDVLALWYFRANHPTHWRTLRIHLLGLFDGFPLFRTKVLGAFAAVFLVDAVVLRRRSAITRLLHPGRSERVDIALTAIRLFGFTLVVPVLLTAGMVSVAPRVLQSWRLEVLADVPAFPSWSNSAVQVVLYTVLVDFLRYWWHRAMHASETLWKFHTVHHSATSFTVITGDRIHPVEDVLAVPLVVFPLVLLGATTAQAVIVVTMLRLIDMAQHSMLPFTYGWFGRWVVYSPTGHRIHHSPEVEHWNKNFGDFIPLWDRLFGTWYGGALLNQTVGTSSDPVAQRGVIASIFEPFDDAARHIRSRWGRSSSDRSTPPPSQHP